MVIREPEAVLRFRHAQMQRHSLWRWFFSDARGALQRFFFCAKKKSKKTTKMTNLDTKISFFLKKNLFSPKNFESLTMNAIFCGVANAGQRQRSSTLNLFLAFAGEIAALL